VSREGTLSTRQQNVYQVPLIWYKSVLFALTLQSLLQTNGYFVLGSKGWSRK
jgi:hypothetical protein